MKLEQLVQQLTDLERAVAEMRSKRKRLRPYKDIRKTFGMFANDPAFDENVRPGREYRETEVAPYCF
jgi:hypothetical protein